LSLIHIRAHFDCDECGKQFSVGIAADYVPPEKWSMFDVAEDSVRGSVDYEEKGWDGGLCSSVQNNKHLCKDCTRKADEANPEPVEEPSIKIGFAAAVREGGDRWLYRIETAGLGERKERITAATWCAMREDPSAREFTRMRLCETSESRVFQVETPIWRCGCDGLCERHPDCPGAKYQEGFPYKSAATDGSNPNG
jgi:hypothetical protein